MYSPCLPRKLSWDVAHSKSLFEDDLSQVYPLPHDGHPDKPSLPLDYKDRILRRLSDPETSLDKHGWKALRGGHIDLPDAHIDKSKFTVIMDCKHFRPDELIVTVDDDKNQLVIHGKHEEKTDHHGYITREFRRKYDLPKDVELDMVTCKLDKGVLSVDVPKVPPPPMITKDGRRIPIKHGSNIKTHHPGHHGHEVHFKLNGQSQGQTPTAMRG